MADQDFAVIFNVLGPNVRSFEMTTATNQSKADAGIGTERLLHMYKQMVSIRLFEEQVNDLYTRALMPGPRPPVHRRRSRRGRNLRGAPPRRLHHEQRIAATAIVWPKRGAGSHVRRIARARKRGLLPRQGRLDAHRRPEKRQTLERTHCRRKRGASRRARRFPRRRWGTKQVAVCFLR